MSRTKVIAGLSALCMLAFGAACSSDPEVVEKIVEVEKEVEVIKEVEVVKEQRIVSYNFAEFVHTTQSSYVDIVKPFLREEFPGLAAAALPDVTLEPNYLTHAELGLTGFETFKLIQQGLQDIAWFSYAYTGGAVPLTEGVDIATFGSDWKNAQQIGKTWMPVVNDAVFEPDYGVRVQATYPAPQLTFFCNSPVTSIDDFKGKKVRVWSTLLSDFLESVGGEGVSLAFAEAYNALQTGVVDCGLTGSSSANSNKWYEVTSHQYTLAPGWFVSGYMVNAVFWNSLDDDVRTFFADEMIGEIGDRIWEYEGEVSSIQGIECNAGTDNCTLESLTKVPADQALITTAPSEADLAKLDEALMNTVLPRWVERCEESGQPCKDLFNEHLAPLAGFSAS